MKKIEIKDNPRFHNKASEIYIDVIFRYDAKTKIETSVPIEYRRTGTDIDPNDKEKIDAYILKVYNEMNPKNWGAWKTEQEKFWAEKSGAKVTKPFFDKLSENFSYLCTKCQLPENSNSQRRIQDLKEMGYTIATRINDFCPTCKKNTTKHILLPIKRGGLSGYEAWSSELRSKIINLLNCYDAFEAKIVKKEGLLPDHKFSEIRWDEKTKRNSLETLTDEEILRDFQLMTNQRNQQKREVCRNCYQTGKRGIIYGIPFFYEGGENWNPKIPKTGKEAEKGCVGCAWYDIERWRTELIKKLK